MQKIVIPVGPDQPEDDIIELVEILKKRFPDQILRTSEALVLETDIPQIEALFKALPTVISQSNSKKQNSGFTCPDCGKPVSKANCRCKSCTMKIRKAREAAQA
jgi:hypothetical protein